MRRVLFSMILAFGLLTSVRAEQPTETAATQPTDVVNELGYLAGTWDLTGKRSRPDGTSVEFTGTDTFSWMFGEAFLSYELQVNTPVGPNQTHGIVKWDAEAGVYYLWTFENTGNVLHYTGTSEGDKTIFQAEGKASGSSYKVRVNFHKLSDTEFAWTVEFDRGDGYKVMSEISGKKRVE